MSQNTEQKKTSATNADGCESTSSSCSFEGRFISITGSRLEMESDNDRKSSYALASDALLTCDGTRSKQASLKAGRRIRITTQKGSPNLVTGIEWLNNSTSLPALESAAK